MRVVRHGTAPLLDHDLEEIAPFEVSTPQTRRAAINDLRRLEGLASARRRRVLLVLLAALSGVIGLCGASLVPWWTIAIPGALLLIFVAVARISVRLTRTRLDLRYREIHHGNNESTIFLSRKDFPTSAADAHRATVKTDVASTPGTLWDPVPITMPTYVSKPLAPRTVRTIDLSGPAPLVTTATKARSPQTLQPRPRVSRATGAGETPKSLPPPDGGKVCVLTSHRSTGLWRSW